MDNAERKAKSLAPERADPERNVSPDRTGPDRNASHFSSLHPCQDPCIKEICIFPAAPGPGGSASARNGPERIFRVDWLVKNTVGSQPGEFQASRLLFGGAQLSIFRWRSLKFEFSLNYVFWITQIRC